MGACYTLSVIRGANGAGRVRQRKISRSERLAFGVHAVEEALRLGEVERLMLLEGNGGNVAHLESFARQNGIRVDWVPQRHLVSLVGKVAHQGVVAQVRPFEYAPITALLDAKGPLVVCCGIEDPGNLGAVLRAAAGLGAGGVFVSDAGSVRVTASVRKGAAGCLHKVPLARGDVRELLALVKDAQRQVLAAVPTGGGDLAALRAPEGNAPALVVGAEGKGVPPEILATADELLTIPLQRDVESLNVAVAVALLLWWATGR